MKNVPEMLGIYRKLKHKIMNKYTDIHTKVAKTQISFRGRFVFVVVSLPNKKIQGRKGRCLLVSFGFGQKEANERIAASVEAYPGRWAHHVGVWEESGIDDELMTWIHDAYCFSMIK